MRASRWTGWCAGLAMLSVLSVLGGGLAAAPASAGRPMPRELTCPVGGERFSHTTTASYSIWGERPDGRPYGSWHFPLALPVCPGNGLVLYRDFTPDEVARLAPLLAGDAYRALAGETSYYRAWWLEKALVPDSEIAPWILLRAVWQASDEPPAPGERWAERHRRYRLLFVREADALAARRPPDGLERLALAVRAANAEREEGRFEAAGRRLAAVAAAAEPAGLSGEDAAQWRHWTALAARLARAVERRNAALEPIAMMPLREARERCGDAAETRDAADRADCAALPAAAADEEDAD